MAQQGVVEEGGLVQGLAKHRVGTRGEAHRGSNGPLQTGADPPNRLHSKAPLEKVLTPCLA
eukprot:7851660-Lingulodinium_polyedra.AAC.1